MITPQTLDELLQAILPILPYSQVGEDNEGQLIIYTNLYETDTGKLADYNDPEDEGFWMDQDHRSLS